MSNDGKEEQNNMQVTLPSHNAGDWVFRVVWTGNGDGSVLQRRDHNKSIEEQIVIDGGHSWDGYRMRAALQLSPPATSPSATGGAAPAASSTDAAGTTPAATSTIAAGPGLAAPSTSTGGLTPAASSTTAAAAAAATALAASPFSGAAGSTAMTGITPSLTIITHSHADHFDGAERLFQSRKGRPGLALIRDTDDMIILYSVPVPPKYDQDPDGDARRDLGKDGFEILPDTTNNEAAEEARAKCRLRCSTFLLPIAMDDSDSEVSDEKAYEVWWHAPRSLATASSSSSSSSMTAAPATGTPARVPPDPAPAGAPVTSLPRIVQLTKASPLKEDESAWNIASIVSYHKPTAILFTGDSTGTKVESHLSPL
ncbi:g4181 [Coccomyxa viridis]|uniref:G4181 protein n=1 Tax=Coccomyxa viridis TaxID=1274662 RepID=A0ABP1FPR7_9CHLO